MSTYAIGDIQGCFEALQRLLHAIAFQPGRDRLWLVGDLVNRGPDSAGVLRWVRDQGDGVVAVLGNHDLHLLAVAEGFVPIHRSDTIQDVLQAPDRAELLDWLRRRPLLHLDGDRVLVHAGLLPQWTPRQARDLAREVERALGGEGYLHFLEHMYGNRPNHWDSGLEGMNRLRLIANAMTRLRFCTPEGQMEFAHKGDPDVPPEGFLPWFDAPRRASREATVIFGHWSALGLRIRENLAALDSGCLWGGDLSALRLEDGRLFQISCRGLPGSKRWR